MDSNVTCLDINYYSNLIVFSILNKLCGTFDKQIALWDVRSKNLIYQILSHSEPITSVNFSPDSTVCVSGSYDGFMSEIFFIQGDFGMFLREIV
jgi:WD40 repeat protein